MKRSLFVRNNAQNGMFLGQTVTIGYESLLSCDAFKPNGHDSLRIVTVIRCSQAKRARFTSNRYRHTMLPS
ncbi:hypothetical protein [Bacillus niameyensis]|uniref:hypothetical protein n=1 Tax=Bacillus niameyensis TaxID=1522308 RepID=UPI001E60BF29|nr:hypothetical protein [Bacillus niameyensis]